MASSKNPTYHSSARRQRRGSFGEPAWNLATRRSGRPGLDDTRHEVIETFLSYRVGGALRIGIVGCGVRGQLFVQALEHVVEVRVAGMCDPSEIARGRAKEIYSGPVFATHDELYNHGLDAVVIATPDFAHRAVAVDAARAGLQLMIEKPLATNVADAEAIHVAVKGAGVSCLVAFENRWNPQFIKIRDMLDNGDFGELTSVSAVLSNTYFVPQHMLSWSASSSPGWFLMPHTLDLAMWLCDAAPRSVVARGHRGILADQGIDTWDSIHALVELDNGAIANLQSSWTLPSSSPSIVDFRVEILGTKGSAQINLTDQGLNTSTTKYATHWPLPVLVDGAEQSMAAWMVRSWAKNLAAGEPLGPDSAHGLVVTRALEDIHRGLQLHQPVQQEA